MFYRASTFIVYCFLRLFFGIEIIGRDAVPSKGPFIMAANHVSNFDPPVLAVTSPRKLAFIAKEELFNGVIGSIYFKGIGAIPLQRQGSGIKALRLTLRVLKKKPIIIFPQGTRTRSLDNALTGVGFLCKKAKVPVVAAKIYGTDKALPHGAKSFSFIKIKVVFARVSDIKYTDTHKEITQKVIDKIKSL